MDRVAVILRIRNILRKVLKVVNRENWMRNSCKNWVVLGKVEECDRGFENLVGNFDVKIYEIESFLEIWGKRNVSMFIEDKVFMGMFSIWGYEIEK